MHYEIEELIPVVGKLAEKYTSGESTSISYERAELLMEAVLYCIHELEQNCQDSLTLAEKCRHRRHMIWEQTVWRKRPGRH